VRVPLKLYMRDQARRNMERLSRPVRIVRGYGEFSRRRALAGVVDKSSCYDVKKMQQDGYLVIRPPAKLVADVVEAARNRLEATQTLTQSRNKAFFSQLLLPEDKSLDGPFMRFALNEKLLQTVAKYLGVAPYLESIELLYSKPVQGPAAQSQQWHKDRTDRRIVKVFVYINDVSDENGPLSLLSRSDSEKVPEFLFHYLTDEEMARYVDVSRTVAFTGQAGTTVMVDSQTCYHLGSRCQKPRLALVVYYSSGFGYRARESKWEAATAAVSPLSPLQRHALGKA
jgi:hypothetical protein